MENQVTTKKTSVASILSQDVVKSRFNDILGKNANAFMSSIISATKANSSLGDCEPNSVISSAVIAATLNLPIQSNLGFAHIVPYNQKDSNGNQVKVAQFQMGYKGFIQLALRTAQYKNINASEVYEGELVNHDRITGEVELDTKKKKSNKVIGYVAYFKLINGFEKMLYLTREQVEGHGSKYSKSYSNKYGRWQQDFDSMALKTVIKLLLSKYGILSVDMQTAITVDQAIIKDAETMDIEYVDSREEETFQSTALNDIEVENIEIKVSEQQKNLNQQAKVNNNKLNFD
jgi:recombination protein RecT